MPSLMEVAQHSGAHRGDFDGRARMNESKSPSFLVFNPLQKMEMQGDGKKRCNFNIRLYFLHDGNKNE